jgi:energy-coupling factor transporter ATP-binding protein EcfA2
MTLPIQIEDIHFGERDALHEYMKQDRADLSILDNSFVNPPRIRMEELRTGARFYILGPKGSGKTTLLWHLKRNGAPNKSKVILFKSELRKEDRDQLDKMVDMIVVEDQRSFRLEADYKTIWEWYILKNIVRLIETDDIVEGSDIFKDIVLLLEADKARFNTLYDKFHIDSIKGNVKLKIDFGALKSEISAEVAARRTDGDRIPLLDLVRLVQASITKIKLIKSASIRIYFDELEFFISDDGDGERDRRMVRDLLFSVYSINNLFSSAGIDVVACASVRSEILHSVTTTTQEISKLVSAFGVSLNWHNEDVDSHPVLSIFENKIRNSEISLEGAYTEDVWGEYFPQKVLGKDFKKYLLDSGMHRPRGVLLRLTAAAELAYGRTRFTKDDFDNSEQKFGEDMLEEFMDEISATYDEPGRQAILSILRGKNYAFTREDILSRMNAVADKNKEVKRLRDRLGVDNLLRLLFRVGLIGNHFTNENKKVRQLWAVRGEANPLLEERFVLHQSVRAALSTL